MAGPPAIQLVTPSQIGTGPLAVGLLERRQPELGGLPKRLKNAALRARAKRRWRPQAGTLTVVEGRPGVTLLLYGLGSQSKWDPRSLSRWVAKVVADAGRLGERELSILLPPSRPPVEQLLERLAREIGLSTYRFDRFLERSKKHTLRKVRLVVSAISSASRDELSVARRTAQGAALARDLANTPPNEANPVWMAEQAQSLAKKQGLRIQILDPKALARKAMGGILAVGGGSRNPPRMVRLEYGKEGPLISLVGKGVTFDTGGISLKPAKSMEEMKYDKCGACAVLGILEAVAELQLPIRLQAYLALAENMPDGNAYRPGDIVRCYNGKTVEIHNTDAEGRMILADALAWAVEGKPDYLLEYSTLTGACVVALGPYAAGMFTPSDELAAGLERAAESTGERVWRLPLWPEFSDEMKGAHADLKNVGGRWGGANAAAAFLANFVGSHQRWCHLDIAGPAYRNEGPSETRGATGYGVALTVSWLRHLDGTN